MKDKRVLTDGSMTLELHLLRGSLHAEGLLVAYVPREKLLIQADAFAPRPGAAPLPAPSPFTTNLVDNVERLKLDVERVAHVHGGIDPWEKVLEAAGRSRAAGRRTSQLTSSHELALGDELVMFNGISGALDHFLRYGPAPQRCVSSASRRQKLACTELALQSASDRLCAAASKDREGSLSMAVPQPLLD